METANKVIVALIPCFIFITAFMTWLAVRVRYYRIANAKLKNRINLADKDLKDLFDEQNRLKRVIEVYEQNLEQVNATILTHRTESAKILNTSTENNSRLQIELNQAKEDNAKLFDIAKGAVAKLAEMNTEVDRIMANKDTSNEDASAAIDLSQYKAFPKGYVIPKGTECIMLKEDKWRDFITPIGTKVITVESDSVPFLKRLDGIHRYFRGKIRKEDTCVESNELAPINQEQHPEHPNFKG